MGDAYRRFKEWLAIRITRAVATMDCAAAFTVLALVSLPQAIHGGIATLISRVAQTFLQLVLLSVIMVGQDIQQRSVDALHDKHDDLHDKHDALHEALKGKQARRGDVQGFAGRT